MLRMSWGNEYNIVRHWRISFGAAKYNLRSKYRHGIPSPRTGARVASGNLCEAEALTELAGETGDRTEGLLVRGKRTLSRRSLNHYSCNCCTISNKIFPSEQSEGILSPEGNRSCAKIEIADRKTAMPLANCTKLRSKFWLLCI